MLLSHAYALLLRRGDDALILTTRYVIERALEMFPRVLKTGCVFIGLQVGVDELDEAVKVLGCNL